MLKKIRSMNNTLQQIIFPAMNTSVEIAFWGQKYELPSVERWARDWFERTEMSFSRFHAQSELSQLNRLAGRRATVSAPMLEILLLAENYRKLTEGIFDPLIGKALQDLGYDESYEILKEREQYFPGAKQFTGLFRTGKADEQILRRGEQLLLDPKTQSVFLPQETEIDLGGIAKSWAVKGLAELLQDRLGLERGLINAGGDLTVWGNSGTDAGPWLIGIENPWTPADEVGILSLSEGSVATSSKLGRTWSSRQGKMHHLIDPRTMAPSASDVVQCTVSGSDVVACEIWAKVICILGREQGLALFSRQATGYEALVFTTEKQTRFFGDRKSMNLKWSLLKVDTFYQDLEVV